MDIDLNEYKIHINWYMVAIIDFLTHTVAVLKCIEHAVINILIIKSQLK